MILIGLGGGYLEDRSFLWNGTYLNKTNSFIHLGIDVNLAAGTPIFLPFDAKVIGYDNDHPLNWGWGPRIFLEPAKAPELVLIVAHLEKIKVTTGDIIAKGDRIASVGRPPFNGNWFPHIHLQVISMSYFNSLQNDLKVLDGYCERHNPILNDGSVVDPFELFRRCI